MQATETIILNLISSAIWLIIVAILTYLGNWLLGLIRKVRLGAQYRIALYQIFSIAIYVISKAQGAPLEIWILILALLAIPFWVLRMFARLGISDAFPTAQAGYDFDASLKAARSSLSFLGIGAHKLTSSPAFSDAMMRCARDGRSARFLLSASDNFALEIMARRNGQDPRKYKQRVNDSLRILKNLKFDEGNNIEVRLYKYEGEEDYQSFRLMFIDGSFCILGWTVWGSHEGRENPQVILRKPADPEKARASMYKAFEDYYNRLWDASEQLDWNNVQ